MIGYPKSLGECDIFDCFRKETDFEQTFKTKMLKEYEHCYLDKISFFSLLCFELGKEPLSAELRTEYIKYFYGEIAIIHEATFEEIITMTYLLDKYCCDKIYIKMALKYLYSIASISSHYIYLVDLHSKVLQNQIDEDFQEQLLTQAKLKAKESYDFLIVSLLCEKHGDRNSANLYMQKGFELLKMSEISEIATIIMNITVYSNNRYSFFTRGWYQEFHNKLIDIKIYHKDFDEFKEKRDFHSDLLTDF